MTNLERLYKKVAEQMEVNKYQVEDIFKSQFSLVAKQMQEYSDVPVRLPYLGTFKSNPELRKLITERKRLKDAREQQQSRET